MSGILNTLILCGTVLGVAFMVLLALPASRLRSFLLQITGWTVAAGSALYVICPIDVLPDFIPVLGWIDDGGALVTAVMGAVAALKAGAERQRLEAQDGPANRVSGYFSDEG